MNLLIEYYRPTSMSFRVGLRVLIWLGGKKHPNQSCVQAVGIRCKTRVSDLVSLSMRRREKEKVVEAAHTRGNRLGYMEEGESMSSVL